MDAPTFSYDELRSLYVIVQTRIGDLLDEVERCNAQDRKDDAATFYAQVEESRALSSKIVAFAAELKTSESPDSAPVASEKIAVLDDCTRTSSVIGYASTPEEAADVFMAYMRDRMEADDFATLGRPTFVWRRETSAASPAWEPI
jgi:hypothetical protein